MARRVILLAALFGSSCGIKKPSEKDAHSKKDTSFYESMMEKKKEHEAQMKEYKDNQDGMHAREKKAFESNVHEVIADYKKNVLDRAELQKELERTKFERQAAELKERLAEHARQTVELERARIEADKARYSETEAQRQMRLRPRGNENVKKTVKTETAENEDAAALLNATVNETWDEELLKIEEAEEKKAVAEAEAAVAAAKAAEAEAPSAAHAEVEAKAEETAVEAERALAQTGKKIKISREEREFFEQEQDRLAEAARQKQEAALEIEKLDEKLEKLVAREAQPITDLNTEKEKHLKELKEHAQEWHKEQAEELREEQQKFAQVGRQELAAKQEADAKAAEAAAKVRKEEAELAAKIQAQEKLAAEKKAAEEAAQQAQLAKERAEVERKAEERRQRVEEALRQENERKAAAQAKADAELKARKQAEEMRAAAEAERKAKEVAAIEAQEQAQRQELEAIQKIEAGAITTKKAAVEWMIAQKESAQSLMKVRSAMDWTERAIFRALGDADLQEVVGMMHSYGKAMRNSTFRHSLTTAKNALQASLSDTSSGIKRRVQAVVASSGSATTDQIVPLFAQFFQEASQLLSTHQQAAMNFTAVAATGMPEMVPFLSFIASRMVPANLESATVLAGLSGSDACGPLVQMIGTYGDFGQNVTRAHKLINSTARISGNLSAHLTVLQPGITSFALQLAYVEALGLKEAATDIENHIPAVLTERLGCEFSFAFQRFRLGLLSLFVAVVASTRAWL